MKALVKGLVLVIALSGCQDGNNSVSTSLTQAELNKFAERAMNSGNEDFEKIDLEFDALPNLDKLEALSIIRKNSVYDDDKLSRETSDHADDQIMELSIKSSELYGDKFIGDLSEEELKGLASSISENSEGSASRRYCLVESYPEWVSMVRNYSRGSAPTGFRRVVNTPGEYPCDYEVKFAFNPSTISSNYDWATYRLLRSFGRGASKKGSRVILGYWRTVIWHGAIPSYVQRKLKRSLVVN